MLYFLLKTGFVQLFCSATDGAVVQIFCFQRNNWQEKQAQKLLSFLKDPATGVVAMKTIFRFQ